MPATLSTAEAVTAETSASRTARPTLRQRPVQGIFKVERVDTTHPGLRAYPHRPKRHGRIRYSGPNQALIQALLDEGWTIREIRSARPELFL